MTHPIVTNSCRYLSEKARPPPGYYSFCIIIKCFAYRMRKTCITLHVCIIILYYIFWLVWHYIWRRHHAPRLTYIHYTDMHKWLPSRRSIMRDEYVKLPRKFKIRRYSSSKDQLDVYKYSSIKFYNTNIYYLLSQIIYLNDYILSKR